MTTPCVPGIGLVPSKSSGMTSPPAGLEPDEDDGPIFKSGEPSTVSIPVQRTDSAGTPGRRSDAPVTLIHHPDL